MLSVIFSSSSTFVRSGMKNTPTIKALVPTAGIERLDTNAMKTNSYFQSRVTGGIVGCNTLGKCLMPETQPIKLTDACPAKPSISRNRA